ncbi:uncharacterized protein VTP21DRAFT_6480 [Calcarisporiella thermophila]|uniref:uncharacterized protein n=1 Tax=Calcarisporiella thermophila TaxID=911321 RepID=UPI003743E2C8
MPYPISPSLEEIQRIITNNEGNTVPVYAEIPADMLTPVSAYLRVADGNRYSFLLESVTGGERIGRYSFIGAGPYKILKTGENEEICGDPLLALEKEMSQFRFVKIPGLPSFTGGAIGYISYDCIHYFEPRTARELKDPFGIPDSMFMFCDTVIVFDRIYQVIKVVSHYRGEAEEPSAIESKYNKVVEEINRVIRLLESEHTPQIKQEPIILGNEAVSNIGKEGYESHVSKLKYYISEGEIFQTVPSQRLTRPTTLHPFNVYRHLRSINPSPYMFYLDLGDFVVVGASPEMLVKVEDRIVYTHPIAGTRKRGKDAQEDEELEKDLLSDPKERAEHIMLVDLGRNDVNRVCKPDSVKVDSLMHIERYSHVMHIVSNVSGELRPEKTIFDAFRSIFPAGTVSGAPKVRAMEIIGELEQEKRGIYAGSVGHFDYSGCTDTCIAIRTMLFKDGNVYLQAGGGIVADSVEHDEYEETVNKLGSNLAAIAQCEQKIWNEQQSAKVE